LKKTQKEIETLETRVRINPTEENTKQLRDMRTALKLIPHFKENEFVPASWRGIELE
jgi:hypothetical protein